MMEWHRSGKGLILTDEAIIYANKMKSLDRGTEYDSL